MDITDPALVAAVPFNPVVDVWKADDWFHWGAFRALYAFEFIYGMETRKKERNGMCLVDAASGRILDRTLGAKALSIRGQEGGGTVVRREDAAARQALPDEAIASEALAYMNEKTPA